MNNYLNILSDLCLIEATSKRAIKQIYKLATHDNEYKNEAYTKFVSLFQVVLADNCLNYDERFEILKELEADYGVSKILIDSYERMLKTGSFYGNIHSGGNDLYDKDYRPHEEALETYSKYYDTAISFLQDIAISDDAPNNISARESIINRLSDQFMDGLFKKIISALRTIIEKEGELKIELRNKLLELKSYRYDFDRERIKLVDEILDNYEPVGIEQELKTIVINPPWIREENELGQYVDVSKNKAIALAEKYLKEEINWVDHIDLLLKGEQRQTFAFANRIGESNYEKVPLLNQIFETYKNIPLVQQNSLFINGISVGTDSDDFTRLAIDKLLSDVLTEVQGIRQLRFIQGKKLDDFEKIKHLLEYLELKVLPNNDLIKLIKWLKDVNYSFALEVLSEIIRKDNLRWPELKDFINDLLYVDHILSEKSFINSTLHIEDLLKISIADNPDQERIEYIIRLINHHYADFNFQNNTLLNSLTYFLLEDYWELTWPILGEYLENEIDNNYGLKNFLERYKFKNEKLFNWASLEPNNRAQIAIYFMDIYFKNENESLTFEPFAQAIIDHFGNNKLMLNRLYSKLSNYTIHSASAEGLYKKRKEMIIPLLDHEFTEVKEFAQKMIDYFDRNIEREKTFGDNYELGY